MTNQELFELLSFEATLVSASITSETALEHDATFIVASLEYPDGIVTVPFVHYAGQDWLFTPYDWQGWLPSSPDEIAEIDWRVNNTDTEATMFNDLPMLAPWVPTPKDANRETRKRLGAQLKEVREARGISIRELSEATGIDKKAICRIEAGRSNATIDTYNSLATGLGLTINLD